MSKFEGIFPALLTPFTKENKINDKVLRELIDWNLEKGVNGFYVCGSTAESFMLSSTVFQQHLNWISRKRKVILRETCPE